MRVDVIMCTWNSNKPYFLRCLESVRREVPIHHFILVDRFSTDGTVETTRKVFPNAVIKQSNVRLALSRKLGIEMVDTEFFMFVDSDIELRNGCFQRIVGQLDSYTGAVHGSCINTRDPLAAWVEWSRGIQARFEEAFARKVVIATPKNPNILVGNTSCTLMRTHLLKDWNPPCIVSAQEQQLLLRHVIKKGYVWKSILDPIAIHHAFRLTEWTTKCRWVSAGGRLIRLENTSIWSLIRDLIKQSILALLASLQTKRPMILLYVTAGRLGAIQGWVGWNKYLEMRRRPDKTPKQRKTRAGMV